MRVFFVVSQHNFCLILLNPNKSDIFCDDYCQEAMDHSMLSDFPVNKLMLYFVQFQYILMWVGIELYSKVGRCLQLNCCPLLSLIFYLLFESIPQIIYRRFT